MSLESPHILVSGNPIDGFSYIGPFPDYASAHAYAEAELRDEEWWLVALQPPVAA